MNWNIVGITTRNTPSDGVIVVISFIVTDGTSTIANDVIVNEINTDDFSGVTEQQVVQLVKQALGQARVDEIEGLVSQKTNVPENEVSMPLPWAN